ncbi:MAG: DUF523 domain-containing protein [Pseudomonadota bacterium]|nr:DUF523 domain-containing protein [Pseudomonadota bacterium]
MGVPRKTICLTRSEREVGCVESNDVNKDYTHRMRVCADEQLQWQRRLYGYLLKKDSPSCGMEDVKILNARVPSRNGVGIYAARLMENLPCLPVEEEGAG